MTPQQVIEHFGSQQAVAIALSVSQPAVAAWVATGSVPPGRQAQLQIITGGKLVAEPIK